MKINGKNVTRRNLFGFLRGKQIQFMYLTQFFPAVPKTEPMGDTVRYVKEGSRVTLHCVISGAIDPPLYVIWYHYTQQIFPENPRHWKTEVTHQDLHNNKLPKAADENEALALSQQSMFDSRKTVRIHLQMSIPLLTLNRLKDSREKTLIHSFINPSCSTKSNGCFFSLFRLML